MRLRPKTVRRMTLLAVVALLVGAALLGFYELRDWQNARTRDRLRREGLEAAAQRRYPEAFAALERYLRENKDDAEALLRYAQARARVEKPDGSHVAQAVRAFEKYLALRPGDADATMALLHLYAEGGYYAEARDLAARSLPGELARATAADLPVLRELVASMSALKTADDQVEPALARLLDFSPLDLDALLTYDALLRRTGRAAAAEARATTLAQKHPGDPRPKLLALLSGTDLARADQVEQLFAPLCELTGLDPSSAARIRDVPTPDESFALRAAALFDAAGKFEHALAILERGARTLGTDTLRRYFARRAWQGGHPEALLDALSTPDPDPAQSAPEIPAFRALALIQLARRPEAAEHDAVLAARPYDFHATSWLAVLRWYDAPASAELVTAVRELKRANKESPREPLISFVLAEALAGLGRTDEAIVAWREAAESPLAIAWATPWVRLSRAYLARDQVHDAVEAADNAMFRAPRSVPATMAKFAATVARAASVPGPAPDIAPMLAFSEGAIAKAEMMPAAGRTLLDELVPGRMLLLARSAREDDARALANAWLERPDGLSRPGLERLASLSAAADIGVEERCLDRADERFGAAPSTSELRARLLLADGRGAEGAKLLASGTAAASPADRPGWEAALAAHLDLQGDPGAGPAWVALADTHPDDLSLQRRALRSPSACADAAFVERATVRIAKATGSEESPSVTARLARVRALLATRPTVRQRDEAIAALRAIISDWPHDVPARLFLADALLLEDPSRGLAPQTAEAIDQLRAAAGASLAPRTIQLRIAELLQREQSFERSRDELRRLIRENPSDDALRRRCAQLLIAQGEDDLALPVLEGAAAKAGATAAPDLLLELAEVLSHAGRDDAALAAYRRVAALRPPAVLIPQTAAGLLRYSDKPAAESLLANLDAPGVAPGVRELVRGRTSELRGDAADAIASYRAALAKDPSLREASTGLVTLLLKAGDLDAARSAADAAAAALPDDPNTTILRQQVLVAARGAAGLDGLAAALEKDPARSAEADVVRAIKRLHDQNRLADPGSLADLAARFPHHLPVQSLVVRQLLSLQPPQADRAARIASRAMTAFPASPEPARLATQAYAVLGQWSVALASARAWRDRDPQSATDANLAVAQALVALHQPRQAKPILEALVRDALRQPDSDFALAVIDLYLRAWLATGQDAEAFRTVSPLLADSPSIRNSAFLPAAADAAPEPVAREWIEFAARASRAIPEDQAALAAAYSTLAGRSERSAPDDARRALDLLAPFLTGTPDPAMLELKALTLQRSGQTTAAADVYRTVLNNNPDRVPSLVNLASVLRASPGHADDALVLVEKAHAITAGIDEGITRLLAAVLLDRAHTRLGAGQFDDAKTDGTRAAFLLKPLADRRPDDIELHLSLARAQDVAEDFNASLNTYQRALTHPGLDARMKAAIQNNASYALLRLARDRAELARAETLAREAVKADESPATLGTLGQVLAAQDKHADAAKVFRQVLARDADHTESLIGLVASLAALGPADRHEASELIARLNADPARQAKLAPPLARQLATARARLQGGG